MYLRFVVPDIDEDSECHLGVFHAVGKLRRRASLEPHELDELDELRYWFNVYLEAPTRWTAAKPPYYRKKNHAICWFRDSAQTHLWQVWRYVAILKDHGIAVRMLKAARVGYVVYEDEYQVVAQPFADTPS